MRSKHKTIQVRGARTHNLKGVDADVPRGQFVVVTGPSGSGKTSFVFDTIFAEGRRRFLETLSLSARQIAGQLERPDVDSVVGLPPTVAVGQALGRAGRLSTVGTLTGLDDDLRLLFSRLGLAHCPSCGTALSARSVGDIVDRIASLPERTKLIVLAPFMRQEPGDAGETLDRVVREGFVRVRINGEVFDTAEAPPLDAAETYSVEAVVDRLIVKPGFEERLRESIDLAVDQGRGACILNVINADRSERDQYESTRFACSRCDVSYPDVDPRTLSFESPYGACDRCRGTGLSDKQTSSENELACSSCNGDRLNRFAQCVQLNNRSIAEVRRLTPDDFVCWLQTISLDDDVSRAIHARVAAASNRRVEAIHKLGLSYLTLDRAGRTLSGGELQRARLVNVLASGLNGVCYVLDEPTAGLHPSDTARLIEELRNVRERRSSVLVVEHDPAIIAAADFVLRFGPRGGRDGGRLTECGSPAADAPTSAAMTQFSTPKRDDDPEPGSTGVISVRSARLRSLKNVSVEIPLQSLVGIAGVSGSGKTTFARDVLAAGVRQQLNGEPVDSSLADAIDGIDQISAVSVLDQTPPGRSSRSCPATVLGVWGAIRTLLSRTKLARLRGFDAKRFSFNHASGRCPNCHGRGIERLRLRYLPPTTVVCPTCRGQRFEPATRTVTFKDHSVSDLLKLSIEAAAELFDNVERIARPLRMARDAGLGYLPLGQPSETVSGGEAQRLKLIQVLTTRNVPSTLFVLDEPTSGLSSPEVGHLVDLFRQLTHAGHTVVCVEHNLALLAACDHVIEFGPGPGDAGGQVVAEGLLSDLAMRSGSLTGGAYAAAMQGSAK